MKDYWLARLISSVEQVDSRKRLQKAVYLLQRAGCPLECDYILHYYGPYSFELASLVDRLNSAGIINEKAEPIASGCLRYQSSITEEGKKALDAFEGTKTGRKLSAQLRDFVPGFKVLNAEQPWILELAATIAFFYQGNWPHASAQAAKFKQLRPPDLNLRKATQLAEKFAG